MNVNVNVNFTSYLTTRLFLISLSVKTLQAKLRTNHW